MLSSAKLCHVALVRTTGLNNSEDGILQGLRVFQIHFDSQVIYAINIQFVLIFLHNEFKVRINVKVFSFEKIKIL
jgi:hypothetical protein